MGRREPRNVIASYLGGPPAALTPRVSPDGKFVAFLMIERRSTQLCVLKADTGDWSTLAEEGASTGTVDDLSWSADSSRIYFARYTDRPAGIYSVPALGGQQRLLLENARGAQAVRDGSLLVSRQTEQGFEQLCRLWPDTGRVRPYEVVTAANWYCAVYRAFPEGREAVVYGWPTDKAGSNEYHRLWNVELNSGAAHPLATTRRSGLLANNYPMAITPEGEVAVFEPSGDLERVVAYSRSRPESSRVLFSGIPPGSTSFDVFPDGSIVYDRPERSSYILRISPSNSKLEYVWTGLSQDQGYSLCCLGGGRFVVAGRQAGRRKLLLLDNDMTMAPLVDTAETTSMPCAQVGADRAALVIGSEGSERIALVEVGSGRILRILFEAKQPVGSLSYSAGARALFFTTAGAVWRTDLNGGQPRKIRAGEFVAAHPRGDGVAVFVHERFEPRLIWKPLTGDAEQEIARPPSTNWANSPLGDRSIREDGMMVCPISPLGAWYFGATLIDLNTQSLQPLETQFVGDLFTPNWSEDGNVMVVAMDFRSSLVRLREEV
jgi:hypothetical protein